jgi:nucleotidyltransferase/DNA polymerase involved in DNA repair
VQFRILSDITELESIARGVGVRDRRWLRKLYGAGRWRKLKGVATIEFEDGRKCLAELHWYEAHGIGRRRVKVKRVLSELRSHASS